MLPQGSVIDHSHSACRRKRHLRSEALCTVHGQEYSGTLPGRDVQHKSNGKALGAVLAGPEPRGTGMRQRLHASMADDQFAPSASLRLKQMTVRFAFSVR